MTEPRLTRCARRFRAYGDVRAAALRAHREHLAAGGNLREVLVDRYLALHGRVDTCELARMLGALDAERPGSWRWTRRAEELRRAIGRAERIPT